MSLVEFKSWWGDWSGSDKLPENADIRYAFEAGQESQQVKTDELQNKLDYHIETNADLARLVLELQARVDEALKELEKMESYDHNEALDNVYLILKGNKDEK